MTGPGTADVRAIAEELGNLLGKLGEQLAVTVQEADGECRSIGSAFRQLAAANRRIAAAPVPGPAAAVVQENCRQISAAMDDAIVALQYQDLQAQRISHIRAGLDQIQGALRDGALRDSGEWLDLLRRIQYLHHHGQQRLHRVNPCTESTVDLF